MVEKLFLFQLRFFKLYFIIFQVLFAIRKDGFKEHPSLLEDLDLVDESDQYTHMLTLDDDSIRTQLETQLNVFRFDPNFEKTEENYKQIKKGIKILK